MDAQHLASRAQEATERGQVTARLTTAVEQLGHTDPSVRLGALYALEALAHDSAGDRVAISEVVCSYARHHSTRRLPDGTPVLIEAGDGDPVVERVDGLAVDYQAAITIALRLPAHWNLPVRNLRGTVAADMDWFGEVTFTGVAWFDGATFTGVASFVNATVQRGLSLPEGVDPGREFLQGPDDPRMWYRYEGDAASRATGGGLA